MKKRTKRILLSLGAALLLLGVAFGIWAGSGYDAAFTAHLTALVLGTNLWMLYLLGVPGQIIIIFWSVIVRRPAGVKKIKAAQKTAAEKTVSARTAEQDGADASVPGPNAAESPQ